MKELTKQEIESQKKLEKDMDSRLAAFKKDMLTKTKESQQKELLGLKQYIDGCRRSEIDDTLVNIRFCEEKITILETII